MQLNFRASPKQWIALWYLTDNITTEIWYWWWAWWGRVFYEFSEYGCPLCNIPKQGGFLVEKN